VHVVPLTPSCCLGCWPWCVVRTCCVVCLLPGVGRTPAHPWRGSAAGLAPASTPTRSCTCHVCAPLNNCPCSFTVNAAKVPLVFVAFEGTSAGANGGLLVYKVVQAAA